MAPVEVTANAEPAQDSSHGFRFRYSGGTITAVRLVDPQIQVIETLSRFGDWIGVVLEHPLAGGPVKLELEVRGDAVQIEGDTVQLVPAGGLHPGRPPVRTWRFVPHEWLTADATTRRHWRRRLVNLEVLSMIECQDPDLKRAAHAFWYLDLQTAAGLMDRRFVFRGGRFWYDGAEAGYRGRVRDQLFAALSERVGDRSEGREPLHARDPHNPLAFRPWDIAYFSSLILEPFRAWFGFLADTDDPWHCSLGPAVDAFAAGRLNLFRRSTGHLPDGLITDGTPNSPAFAFFAELGLVACELDVHRSAWNKLLPVFIGALQIYRHAYGAMEPLTVQEYLRQHELGPKPSPDAPKDPGRRYEKLTIEELSGIMTANIRSMFAPRFAMPSPD